MIMLICAEAYHRNIQVPSGTFKYTISFRFVWSIFNYIFKDIVKLYSVEQYCFELYYL